MTEKRFKEIISTQKVIDTQTGKEYDCLLDNDLFDLINTIAEENEQLKHDATVLICSNQEYRKENEQLKEELHQQEVSEQRRREYDDFWKEKINKVKKNDK